MNGLQELYEDALGWLSFEQASDDIHWYAYRVVKAFEKEAQKKAKPDVPMLPLTYENIARSFKPVKKKTNLQPIKRRSQNNGSRARQMSFL